MDDMDDNKKPIPQSAQEHSNGKQIKFDSLSTAVTQMFRNATNTAKKCNRCQHDCHCKSTKHGWCDCHESEWMEKKQTCGCKQCMCGTV